MPDEKEDVKLTYDPKQILYRELKPASTQKLLDEYETFLKAERGPLPSETIMTFRYIIGDFIINFLPTKGAGIYT